MSASHREELANRQTLSSAPGAPIHGVFIIWLAIVLAIPLLFKAYSKFIDDCIDHAALNWGVVFVFRPSEREAVRYVAKPRKKDERNEAVPA